MTYLFGLVAALALCANNLELLHTILKLRSLLFPNMLTLPMDLSLGLKTLHR